jgi:hypothetical protein
MLLIAAFLLALTSQPAAATSRESLCAREARDYANLIAPRSGAPAVRAPDRTPAIESNSARAGSIQMPQHRDMITMAPNRDAYRAAYDRCMMRR